jgi:prephenate dehydrogenase
VDRCIPKDASALAIFDDWIAADDKPAVEKALRGSSLAFVCTPVHTIMKLLPWLLENAEGYVTDCGSTKQAIAASIQNHRNRQCCVLGHPMAGHPQGGLENARADLFFERKWILCSEGSSDDGLQVVESYVRALGAIPVRLPADVHDKSVAQTSHLPQVVASALAVQAADEDALQAAGPGYASATRVAGGAEAMWRDIFETNGEAIGLAMQHLGERLMKLGDEMQQGRASSTLDVLEHARALRFARDDPKSRP